MEFPLLFPFPFPFASHHLHLSSVLYLSCISLSLPLIAFLPPSSLPFRHSLYFLFLVFPITLSCQPYTLFLVACLSCSTQTLPLIASPPSYAPLRRFLHLFLFLFFLITAIFHVFYIPHVSLCLFLHVLFPYNVPLSLSSSGWHPFHLLALCISPLVEYSLFFASCNSPSISFVMYVVSSWRHH